MKSVCSRKSNEQVGTLIATATNMIAKSLPEVLTDELREFIKAHKDVPEFKELVFTLILLALDDTNADVA